MLKWAFVPRVDTSWEVLQERAGWQGEVSLILHIFSGWPINRWFTHGHVRPSINLALTQNVLRGQTPESLWMTVQTRAPLLARRVALHMIFSFSEPRFFLSIWKMQMDNIYLKKLLWRIKKEKKPTKEIRDFVDSYHRKFGMVQNSPHHVLAYSLK